MRASHVRKAHFQRLNRRRQRFLILFNREPEQADLLQPAAHVVAALHLLRAAAGHALHLQARFSRLVFQRFRLRRGLCGRAFQRGDALCGAAALLEQIPVLPLLRLHVPLCAGDLRCKADLVLVKNRQRAARRIQLCRRVRGRLLRLLEARCSRLRLHAQLLRLTADALDLAGAAQKARVARR